MRITPEHLAQVDSFEKLAELFHDELGWPQRTWATFEGAADLYDIPPEDIEGVKSLSAVRMLEPGQTWGIFKVDFGAAKLRRSQLRAILNKVADKARRRHDNPTWLLGNILFVCRSETTTWTLGHYSGDKPATAKLKTFGWTDPLSARTAIENLNKLAWGADWEKAWDIEKLTKDFFLRLSDLFYDLSDALEPKIKDENDRRLFVQTLFNRLLFLRFVEKKGWLRFPPTAPGLASRPDYLRALWEAGQTSVNPFWPTRLNALFSAVNHPRSDRAHEVARPLVGEVEYLNGGLFEDDPRFVDPELKISPSVFEELLGPEGLFYRYNFTVDESAPLDVQVAVDPEILGRIFEQLTISSKRHDTGSYYTPREIVQFMCREALVGYLGGKGLDEEKARKLVYEHDDSTLSNPEGTLAFEALKAVKVVDPACGSGAYLLGMLQELYALFEKLRRQDRKFSDEEAKEFHLRKLWIIENNIYGVDLQAFATNTAMLRLWLTLLVEDSGKEPQPLPNLEYKIETGNALLGPDPSQPVDWNAARSKAGKSQQSGLDYDNIYDSVRELCDLRAKYQELHGLAKIEFKEEQLEPKLAELREKATGSRLKDPARFDWRVEFFDVFLTDPAKRAPGFDVALANPPYVTSGKITSKPALKERFKSLYDGDADLYCYFYYRSLELLVRNGMISFISSHKWLRAEYGTRLRGYLGTLTHIRYMVHFGDLPVFDSAEAYPMIVVACKGEVGATNFTQVESLGPPYPDILALIRDRGVAVQLPAQPRWILADAATMAQIAKMESGGTPLAKYLGKTKISYGIKTGFNQAFFIDGEKRAELIAEDPKSAEIIKPLAVGDDVRRWRLNLRDAWLIFARKGIELGRYPAIRRHLAGFREELEPKPKDWRPRTPDEKWHGRKSGTYKWYEIQDDIAYYAEFDKPKIVYPVMAQGPRFAIDPVGTFTNDKAFIIPIDDPFLLGVLNSRTVWEWITCVCSPLKGATYEQRSIYMETLPIPPASEIDRKAISSLVGTCVEGTASSVKGGGSPIEAEIDDRVEFLYFHQTGNETYDEWKARLEAEAETAVGAARMLMKSGEDDKNEFKSSIIWNVRADRHDLVMRDEVLKEICAFLNTDGGTILDGVDDDGNLLGLEKDLKHAGGKDKLGLVITNALGDLLKPHPVELVKQKFIEIDGETILRIDVTPDRKHRYESPSTKKEDAGKNIPRTHVRIHGSAKALEGQDLINWWERRSRQGGA